MPTVDRPIGVKAEVCAVIYAPAAAVAFVVYKHDGHDIAPARLRNDVFHCLGVDGLVEELPPCLKV